MTKQGASLLRDRRGAAAAEMALVLPLLLLLLFSSLEIGNYFMNEHTLVKAARNGARFASRQSFTNYPDCTTVSATMRDETRDVVMRGYLDGGTIITPNIRADDIAVTTRCATTAGGETMSGIYNGRATGAQVVIVTATVDYLPILSVLGFSGIGLRLNAASEAAVAGL